MARGIITAARDLLRPLFFNGWERKQQVQSDAPRNEIGWISQPVPGADKTLITPSNYESQIQANRGPVHASLRLISNQVGAATLRIYRPKRGTQKSVLYETKVRPVPEPRRTQLLEKAGPGSALALADHVEEIVAGHRLIDLFVGVSEIYDIFQLQNITAAYLELIGNCYWWPIKDAMGIPTSITIAPGEYMKVKQGGAGKIAGYQYKHGKIKKDFEADEIIHFKLPAPGAQFQLYGRGDLMGAQDDYNLLQHMYTFEKALFENGGVPATMISIQGSWTPAQRESFREEYLQRFGGSNKAGKPMVGENVKVESLGLSPRELAYQQGRRFSNTNVYSNMGVAEAMMTGQVSTRAALEASLTQVLMFSVDPMLRLIQQALNAQLIPMYKDPIYVEYDNVIPEDKEFKLEEDTKLLEAGAVAGNEVRSSRGMEDMDGLDVPYMNFNRVQVGSEPAVRGMTEERIAEIFGKAYAEAKSRMGE